LCPKIDMHLTYMIDIALTVEFMLAADGVR
jgi:hypothetical protein